MFAREVKPLEWPMAKFTNVRDWGDMPYEQRMRRIRFMALTWMHFLNSK